MTLFSKRVALWLAVCLIPTVTMAGSINVLSAVEKDQPVENADVYFQTNGEQTISTQSSASGVANSAFVNDANTLMIIKKAGYSTLVAKCPCDGFTYALSPVMNNLDGLRIVLTWGAQPLDLDSHTVYPNNHVYFDNKIGQLANLDVDDTNSYGPETITLEKQVAGQKYVYSVYDYSNKDSASSHALSQSHARVEVYVGETMIRSYVVDPTQNGTAWVVFGIDGEGAFHDINQYTDLNQSNHLALLDSIIAGNSFESHSFISAENIARAKSINTQGETVYHEGRLEDAMYLFQDAISLNPNFGQAYSNLGLAFQKLDRNAEALWANQKAIDLASGSRANVVKASSHYNIAKINEAEGRWQQALDHYSVALSLREHDAYRKGIDRMNAKLN